MSNQLFDKPILNSPYVAPAQHWDLDKDGPPTQRVINDRREAELTTPVPEPKKGYEASTKDELRADFLSVNTRFIHQRRALAR